MGADGDTEWDWEAGIDSNDNAMFTIGIPLFGCIFFPALLIGISHDVTSVMPL